MLQARNRQFKLDLAELHAICEANYVRFLRLFPAYETSNVREFQLGPAHVHLEVIERCRYTTIFSLSQQHAEARWLGDLKSKCGPIMTRACWKSVAFNRIGVSSPAIITPTNKCISKMKSPNKIAFLRTGWNIASAMAAAATNWLSAEFKRA